MLDDGDRDVDDVDDDSHAIKLNLQDPNSFSSSMFSLNGSSSAPAASTALFDVSSSVPEQSRSDQSMNVMHSRDRDSGGKFTVKQGPKIGTHNGCKRSYLGVKLKRKYLSSDNYSTLMKTAHVRLEESMIPIPMSKQMSMPINTTADDPSLSSDMFSPTDPYMQLIGVADQLLSTGSASSDGGTDGGIELEQQNSSMQKYQHFNDVFQQQYQEQQQYQLLQQQHQGHHQQHQYEYGHYSNNFGGASNSSSSSHMMPAQHSTKNNPHRVYHSHTVHQPSNHIPYYGGVNSQMIHTSRVGQQQPESASSRVTAAVKAMVAQQQQTSKLFRADKDFQQSGRQQQQQQQRKEDKYSSPNFDYSQLFLNSTGNNNNTNNNSNNTNNNDSCRQQLLVDTTTAITTATIAHDATNVREGGGGDVSGIDDNPNWRDQLHYWVGLLSYVSDRKHLQWKGSWLASYVGRPSLDEFTNSGNYFEYDSESVDASQVSSDDGALKPWSCFYSGYYLMDLDGTGAIDKYVDNEFYMDFDLVEKTFSSSKYSVLGKGDNEFGAFIVTGRYDTQSGLLELTRQYVAEDDIRCNMSIHQLKQLLQMISNQARGFV